MNEEEEKHVKGRERKGGKLCYVQVSMTTQL